MDGMVGTANPQVPPERTVAVWQAMRRGPRRFLLSLWPWRCWAYALSGAVIGAGALFALALLVAMGVLFSIVGVGLAVLVLAALFGIPVGALERRRLRLVEPAPLENPHALLRGAGGVRRLGVRLRERATWRELAYTIVYGVVFAGSGFGVMLGLLFAGVLTALPVLVVLLEPGSVMILDRPVSSPLEALLPAAVGLVGLAGCAYAAALLAGAQVRTAEFLLSGRAEERRVVELTRSRARLADAFEAERRRIERDLHDGAQQQLVALSMTLGLAELELNGSGSPAADLVVRARGEARQALSQLRDLVRGIHPQVLTDHGLDAAVAEVALRSPISVTVDIELPGRLPGAVETVAYFTVTEALANAAKHSGATGITVAGRVRRGTLVLTVTDNGRGGAVPSDGTGLQGLADRMAILKGRLMVSSPVGGPTELRAEVPCSA
ncbi:sensor domain-containing protein [Streptomyces sp. NPDC050610]|uniref:sensor histidine kinase n=1 Tax=Streptomyces sp. NPDC050610 TaxID=3157097 RepID=UPI003437B006